MRRFRACFIFPSATAFATALSSRASRSSVILDYLQSLNSFNSVGYPRAEGCRLGRGAVLPLDLEDRDAGFGSFLPAVFEPFCESCGAGAVDSGAEVASEPFDEAWGGACHALPP